MTWLDPIRGPWLTTDVHLRASGWRGEMGIQHFVYSDNVTTQGVSELMTLSGSLTPGLSVGWKVTDSLSVSAAAETIFGARRFFDIEDTLHAQGWISPTAGPRVALRLPVGQQHISLRYDFRYVPVPYNSTAYPFVGADWIPTLEHGLAIGMGARR